jgi:hypothetical protein
MIEVLQAIIGRLVLRLHPREFVRVTVRKSGNYIAENMRHDRSYWTTVKFPIASDIAQKCHSNKSAYVYTLLNKPITSTRPASIRA